MCISRIFLYTIYHDLFTLNVINIFISIGRNKERDRKTEYLDPSDISTIVTPEYRLLYRLLSSLLLKEGANKFVTLDPEKEQRGEVVAGFGNEK